MVNKFLFLFLICTYTYGQGIFIKDSSDKYVSFFNRPEVELNTAQKVVIDTFNVKFLSYFDTKAMYENIYSKNIDDLEIDLYESKLRQIDFLKEKENVLGSSLFNKALNEVNFNYWHYIFSYPILRGNKNQTLKRVQALPAIMVEAFPKNELKNDSALSNNSFRKLLPYYVTYLNSKERGYLKYGDQLQAIIDKTEFALKNLSIDQKDYVLANLLNNSQKFLKTGTAKSVISQIQNEGLRTHFQGAFLDSVMVYEENAKILREAEENKLNKGLELTDLNAKTFGLNKYKGKVVYVDFWASWCGPCRMEFPHSKTMKAGLTDVEKKNIVFLNISIDDQETAWKEAIKSLGLEDFEHGYSKGGWSSQAVQKFQIKGIPRYMIIDKEGKVVDANAPRPSNPDTIEKLRSLIR